GPGSGTPRPAHHQQQRPDHPAPTARPETPTVEKLVQTSSPLTPSAPRIPIQAPPRPPLDPTDHQRWIRAEEAQRSCVNSVHPQPSPSIRSADRLELIEIGGSP